MLCFKKILLAWDLYFLFPSQPPSLSLYLHPSFLPSLPPSPLLFFFFLQILPASRFRGFSLIVIRLIHDSEIGKPQISIWSPFLKSKSLKSNFSYWVNLFLQNGQWSISFLQGKTENVESRIWSYPQQWWSKKSLVKNN